MHDMINKLLHLSLEAGSLEELLGHTIDYLACFPRLALASKGAIFMVEDEPGVLVMKARTGLPVRQQAACARVPFGECICGRAAESGGIVFAGHGDRDDRCLGDHAHGHYCIPILSSGRVLGVINLYVKEGHRKNRGAVKFFDSVAKLLAVVIERKRAECELKAHKGRCEAQNEELQAANKRLQLEITQRKQAEGKLFKAAKEWRSTFDAITDLVSIHDRNFRLLRVNKAFAKAFKMAPADLIGKSCCEVVHGAAGPIPNCAHLRTVATKKPAKGEFYEPRLGAYLEMATSPIFDDKGEVIASVHVTRDVTERRRAEEALMESEERYRALVNLRGEVGEAVVMLQDTPQVEGKQAFVSDQWCGITGYSKEELLKMSFFDLVHPKDRESALERHSKKIKGEVNPGLFELALVKKDGSEIQIELTSGNTTYQGKAANVAYIRDITRRKKMDNQLIITDRLASVGELASGIAHELNNPLTSVIGFSQLVLDKEIPEEIEEDVKIISHEAQRAAGVVKNLLTFARKHEPAKELTNIHDIVNKVLELRAYEQKVHNIQVKTLFAPKLPRVMADYFQLQQVFLNIVINAEFYMIQAHGKGTLTITTEEVDSRAKVTFADDGPGIPEASLEHLFDPFFTTKEVGKGTGLGLSICHGIIAEHGGKIYAEGELGKGATFIVELPKSDA